MAGMIREILRPYRIIRKMHVLTRVIDAMCVRWG